jgi:hypothetical protein
MSRIFIYLVVMRRDESHLAKKDLMNMNVDRHSSRGRPKQGWMDYVKDDIRIKRMSIEKRLEEGNMLC